MGFVNSVKKEADISNYNGYIRLFFVKNICLKFKKVLK